MFYIYLHHKTFYVFRKDETTWRKNADWKARYSKLYSSRHISLKQEEEPRRISFMSNDSPPYASLLMRMRANKQESGVSDSDVPSPGYLTTLLSERSDCYGSYRGSLQSDNLGGNETMLLDMVRARSKEMDEEIQDKTLDLPRDDVSEDQSCEACMRGLSMRMTERSVSRSRASRMSTRRDMHIPSILAFTTSTTAPVQLEIPAFQKVNATQRADIPRWSIRRYVCPVCSQKWKDRTTINNVKNSGLKRNSSMELPTIIAPARLRTSIAMAYVPRPTLAAVDEEKSVSAMRNTGASWQLIRARRFRTPKLQMPSPEARAPPSATAPLAIKDLDLRVNRFLTDEWLTK